MELKSWRKLSSLGYNNWDRQFFKRIIWKMCAVSFIIYRPLQGSILLTYYNPGRSNSSMLLKMFSDFVFGSFRRILNDIKEGLMASDRQVKGVHLKMWHVLTTVSTVSLRKRLFNLPPGLGWGGPFPTVSFPIEACCRRRWPACLRRQRPHRLPLLRTPPPPAVRDRRTRRTVTRPTALLPPAQTSPATKHRLNSNSFVFAQDEFCLYQMKSNSNGSFLRTEPECCILINENVLNKRNFKNNQFLLGKSALQILPIVITLVSHCMCICVSVTFLRKRLLPSS